MAKTRITQSAASSFAGRLTAFTFEAIEAEALATEDAIYWRIYDYLYTKEEQKKMNALPDGWLRAHNCIRVNAGGYSVEIIHAEGKSDPRFLERTFKNRGYCNGRVDISDADLNTDIQKHVQGKEKTRDNRRAFYAKTESMAKSFRNWEDVIAAEPSMEPFIKKWVGLEQKVTNDVAPIAVDVFASVRELRGSAGVDLAEAA
jgi:hypothetical protein